MQNGAVITLALSVALLQDPSTATTAPGRIGVLVGAVPDAARVVPALTVLHSAWVRVNNHLDGRGSDLTAYLRANIDLVVTINNADPGNVDTAYGSPAQFAGAGFPFRSRERYQERVRDALLPLLPFLKRGRQVWAQCENEITDASVNPRSRFWRGTLDQYVAQLDAFAGAVHSVDPSIPIVLTSVASRTLDAIIEPANFAHRDATRFVMRLLESGNYDAADLRFYGCVDDIVPKIAWVGSHLPRGRRWISTENGGPDDRCRTTPRSYEDDPAGFEREQARQVPLRLSACADRRGAICLWFSLFDLPGEEGAFTHLGLIEVPGGRARRCAAGARQGAGREHAGGASPAASAVSRHSTRSGNSRRALITSRRQGCAAGAATRPACAGPPCASRSESPVPAALPHKVSGETRVCGSKFLPTRSGALNRSSADKEIRSS